MRTIRNVLFVGTFSVLALGLSGCESMQTARDKMSSIDFPYFGDSDEAEKAPDAVTLASAADCPQVAIVDDLKNLTQFETPSAPTPGTKISSITLSNMESTCSLNEKTVAVDLTLTFDGQIGPKATSWKTESHSFAYPYFIAVTTPTGEILSKEVFAATIRYDGDETAITQKENIRQVIPLREKMSAAGYEILIGFQLTDDELNYSRMMANQPVAEAAPVVEEKPKPKKKVAKKAPKKEEPAVEAAKVEPVTATPTTEPAATETTTATTPEATAPVAGPVAPSVTATPETPAAPATATPASETTTAPAAAPVAPEAAPATTDGSAAATPVVADPAAATVTPAIANPYAPPPTQVIRIKADGSVEKQ